MFLCATLILISLVEGIFGQRGFIVNNTIEQEIAVHQTMLDVATVELDNLEYRLDHMWDTDSLLDSARTMGYARKGEVVYYFIDDHGQQVPMDSELSHSKPVFKAKNRSFSGISPVLSTFIGVLTAAFLIAGVKIGKRRHCRDQQDLQE